MKVAIAVIFGLIALGNIGIDITPLLAGAGIVGLAVGFGAQKLVADVVSGIFFLVDDAFRTGEYVEVEGTVGTVEKISIRSMQLRHHK
ncbi:MAG: mechanosensitive ion channel domain-containing protein, partial [Pseudomonadota bacterium]